MIRVVGTGHPGYGVRDLRAIVGDSQIIARSAAIVEEIFGPDVGIQYAFDDLFNDLAPDAIPEAIASELLDRSQHGDITYVVPGHGQFGDATVAHLVKEMPVTIVPGSFAVPAAPTGSVQIIDALELAIAEEAAPFDAGLAPIEPTMSVVVTNFYGQRIIGPAALRLQRIYGDFVLEPDVTHSLFFERLDAINDASASIHALAHIMARLRRPDGCPWDREQTQEALMPMLQGEVEELIEAVESGDALHQMEETGDVLMHLVMLSQLAHERGEYRFEDVIEGIRAKMVRRHPHVFAGRQIDSIEDLYDTWNEIKHQEKNAAN